MWFINFYVDLSFTDFYSCDNLGGDSEDERQHTEGGSKQNNKTWGFFTISPQKKYSLSDARKIFPEATLPCKPLRAL